MEVFPFEVAAFAEEAAAAPVAATAATFVVVFVRRAAGTEDPRALGADLEDADLGEALDFAAAAFVDLAAVDLVPAAFVAVFEDALVLLAAVLPEVFDAADFELLLAVALAEVAVFDAVDFLAEPPVAFDPDFAAPDFFAAASALSCSRINCLA